MNASSASTFEAVVYCHCAGMEVTGVRARRLALERLYRPEQGFHALSDLCASVAAGDPVLAEIARCRSALVAACHPRAVKWLFAAGGAPLPEKTVFLNLRSDDAEREISALGDPAPGQTGAVQRLWDRLGRRTDAWAPWFPVIDRDRCTDCRQCLNFCLFGVYAPDGDAVRVVQPRKCKTGCPACARTCPRGAIIFPRYRFGPINGSEAVEEPASADGEVRADALRVFQAEPDLYAALRARTAGGERQESDPR